MKIVHTAILAAVMLSGCATSPKNIEAAYVSPLPYQNLTCEQLQDEAARVSAAAAVATGQQTEQANKDAVAMGVGMIVFWPALFFIGGDKSNAAEVSRLRGEMKAIEDVSTAKKCGIVFQQAK
jgi:hypothetical protein